jgi:hypothetical protein
MLIGMLQQLRSRFHLFNTFAWSSPELVGQIIREHEQYIEAFEKRRHQHPQPSRRKPYQLFQRPVPETVESPTEVASARFQHAA